MRKRKIHRQKPGPVPPIKERARLIAEQMLYPLIDKTLLQLMAAMRRKAIDPSLIFDNQMAGQRVIIWLIPNFEMIVVVSSALFANCIEERYSANYDVCVGNSGDHATPTLMRVIISKKIES